MGDAPEVLAGRPTKRGGAAAVNAAMTALRQLIPTEPKDRRLSKVETLRLAAGYIAHLSASRVQSDGGAPRPNCAPFCVFCVTERRSARCSAETQHQASGRHLSA
ncbi:transcription factor 15-like [Dermacentor silvarum]|uniref:transcription factor 15-like n=1 Tax=Dermacentor silvarum TaxID=543639 RepID=UPI002100CD0B|nr:transcription factor 15-like [Dermacentor silvarum]